VHVILPNQLSSMFDMSHFAQYPFVRIPQMFKDQRGVIANIADGNLGDVAVIHSTVNSIRANHTHENDWHLSYMVTGSMTYFWKESIDSKTTNKVEVVAGDLIYTPSKTPHKMVFSSDSIFVAVAALSRDQESYEEDTMRLSENYFNS